MENLDGTVIATALPQMARSFGALPVDLNVGISAYLLTLGVLIPISGWVAERFGARRVFAVAIVIFTVASALCGRADSVGMFVAMRILQGAGGAMMVPVGRLVVLATTPKENLISAIATLTWPGLTAPLLGPPLGGFITDHASWRWIFYLNLPLGVFALICALVLIPARPPGERRPFDLPGFLASGAGVASFMLGIELIGRTTVVWDQVAGFVGVGAVLIAVAFRHFRTSAHPMIDLSGLRQQSFAVVIRGGSLFRMAIGAVPFLLPLLFQVGFGFDAFHAGLLTLAVFAGNLAIKPATTPILRRFGFRQVLVVTGLANTTSLMACALFTRDTPVAAIVLVLFVGGMLRSMQFTAVSTLAFADIPPRQMGGANTLFSTSTQLTMGMGVALGAIAIRLGRAFGAATGLGQVAGNEFRLAFVMLGLVALLGVLDCLRLAPDAGDNVVRKAAA